MEKIMRKGISFLLALLIMLELCPLSTAYAAEPSGGVQARLDQIMADYPSGSFFTVNGKACTHASKETCSNCSLKAICKKTGKSLSSGQGDAWTCVGFASYVMNQVYGLSITGKTQIGKKGLSTSANTFANAKVGDLIYFYTESGKFGHIAVFMGHTSNGIILYDCNAGKRSEVLYRSIPYQKMTQYYKSYPYCRVYRANNYTDVNGKGKIYTVTFDANGGKVSSSSKTVEEGALIGSVPTPTRAGYQFLGWSESPSGGGMLITANSIYVDEDITLYALWRKQVCTEHTKGDLLRYASEHPHYNYYECAVCGEEFTDESTSSVANCKSCNPGPVICTTHTKGESMGCDNVHPHYNRYSCAICWEVFYDGSTRTVENCAVCNPPSEPEPSPAVCTSHTKGKSLDYGSDHPHYNYYECSACGEEFTDKSTSSAPSCDDCWGDWSEWSATKVSSSGTRQVETRKVKVSDSYTEYRYGRYVDSTGKHDCWCGEYLESLSYVSGKAKLQYSSWTKTRYDTSGKGWSCGHCSADHTGVDHTGSDGRDWWTEYVSPNGRSYYWEESRRVDATYETQYRYRDLQ